jgi:hypothetical protein
VLGLVVLFEVPPRLAVELYLLGAREAAGNPLVQNLVLELAALLGSLQLVKLEEP